MGLYLAEYVCPGGRVKKILMTGATGFLGRHVAWRLIGRGYDVVNLERPNADRGALETRAEGRLIRSIPLPDEGQALIDLVRAESPDCAVLVAAVSRGKDSALMMEQMLDVNVVLHAHIARAMLECGRALVTCGTSWQTSSDSGDYAPFDVYAATKEAYEALLQAFVAEGLSAISMRMFDNYGADDTRGKILDLIMNAIARQESLDMSPGEQEICLVYVEDAAEAVALAAERAMTNPRATFEVFGVMPERSCRLRDVAALIGEIAGLVPPIRWGGRPYRPREIMRPYMGYARLPNWSPRVSLRDGLEHLWRSKVDAIGPKSSTSRG